ncbi:putative T7SS-secreted protein [Streptomyces sp. MAR4 CNX-425]|uniref:putative T7SS-secreted protein n=1 Tax=Streptomyces sp. MAR4 CNX-425 TaxID=3406343 RepID=UPI003B5055D7
MRDWYQVDPGHTEEAKARFPGLGFDPCPGDPRAAEWVAGVVRRAARSLDEISQVLNGRGDGEWRGKAAEEFRRQFNDDFRPKIDKARESFTQSAKALEEWAAYMPPEQDKAREYEEQAHAARERAEEAKNNLAGLPPEPSWFALPKNDREEREAKEQEKVRSEAENAVGNADRALEAIRDDAKRLADRYRTQGEDIADRLKRAMDIAPNEPGLFDKIGSAVAALDDVLVMALDNALGELKKFLKENAWVFKMIGDIAGTLSVITGLLSLAFPWMAPFALGLGALALTSHYLMAVGTTGSFQAALTDQTVLIDAAGLAFGGGAFAAGKALTRIVGPGTSGLFKTAITQPGRAVGGWELSASTLQFTGNWMGNSVGALPGGGAQNTLDTVEAGFEVGKEELGFDGKPKLPPFLDPNVAKKATREAMAQ